MSVLIKLQILQARAASAQKRAQKVLKNVQEMGRLDTEHVSVETTADFSLNCSRIAMIVEERSSYRGMRNRV